MKTPVYVAQRYPKGPLAMTSVYSFTAASILASIIFSLLLFLSIDQNPLMQVLFGGLAVIFELGKFYAWYEFGERRSRRNFSGAFTALSFYSVLAMISIGGSVGGINSATTKVQGEAVVQQNRIAHYNQQIEGIEKQIALNNIAAEKYIELERIASGLSRIQQENAELMAKQQVLAAERDNMPIENQGSVVGLIDGLATFFNITSQQAQLGLVIFLSVLLDFFAAFFVGLIGEELRFKREYFSRNAHTESISAMPTVTNKIESQVEVVQEETTHIEPVIELSNADKVAMALDKQSINCTKRAVISHLALDPDEVDKIFQQFMADGSMTRKPNNHYLWHGKAVMA